MQPIVDFVQASLKEMAAGKLNDAQLAERTSTMLAEVTAEITAESSAEAAAEAASESAAEAASEAAMEATNFGGRMFGR